MLRILALSVLLAGCFKKPPASQPCVNNTTIQFKRIDDRVKRYQTGDRSPGGVYWSRYYLETARFVLTGKGIDGSGAACTSRDHESRQHARMMKDLKAREKDVAWMEAQRGVSFDGLEDGGIVRGGLKWTWTKTAQPVANNDANTL
jgi:hypothetical protein